MPPRETGKQRASRIPLDYYKRPNLLERWKTGLAALALLVTVGWLVAGTFQRDEGQLRYSRGPVANVHAIWDDNCNACHVPFSPITGETWPAQFASKTSLTEYVDFGPHSSNQRCIVCHAGPAHHKGQSDPDCATCHREHRGRDASLVMLADSACIQCHRDLANHGGSTVKENGYENVTRFASGTHPDFRSIKSDPGSLKFSHERHLKMGITLIEGGTEFCLKDITDKADRDRYRIAGEKDNAPVKLECASCHQRDNRDFSLNPAAVSALPEALLKPARGSGAYMAPITYENQCRACHPLTFEDKTIPHRLQPAQIHQTLLDYYAAQLLDNESKNFKLPVPVRPLPGKMLGDEKEKLEKLLKNKVLKAEAYFFRDNSACKRCHEFMPANGASGGNKDEQDSFDMFTKLEIKPVNVPNVWLKHALFNHAAHRGVDCLSCHENAPKSDSHKDVLVPGMQNCVECHAPQTKTAGQMHGGARFSCTECHRYHGGDDPLHGIGSQLRGVEQKRNINEFLLDRKSK